MVYTFSAIDHTSQTYVKGNLRDDTLIWF